MYVSCVRYNKICTTYHFSNRSFHIVEVELYPYVWVIKGRTCENAKLHGPN